LGLTDQEARNLQESAAIRALHPASVAEIIANISTPIPGLYDTFTRQPLPDIEPAVFQKHLGYLAFANSYESASPEAINLAGTFLHERELNPTLLGVWEPRAADLACQDIQYYPEKPPKPALNTQISRSVVLTGPPARPNPFVAWAATANLNPLATQAAPRRPLLPQNPPQSTNEANQYDPSVNFSKSYAPPLTPPIRPVSALKRKASELGLLPKARK
jgi:hypothetical protein